MHGADRPRITLFPHVIVGREIFVNDCGMSFERPNVKGQHPRKLLEIVGCYKSVQIMELERGEVAGKDEGEEDGVRRQ
jgi:hypothetical protein